MGDDTESEVPLEALALLQDATYSDDIQGPLCAAAACAYSYIIIMRSSSCPEVIDCPSDERTDAAAHDAPLGLPLEATQVGAGRPDSAYAKRAVAEQVTAIVGGGWFGDETTVREFPPLRAAWAKRGKQQVIVISGHNGQRVIHRVLDVTSGDFVSLIRERGRQEDCVAFVQALGQLRPDVSKLLAWDNTLPHHPKRVAAVAEVARVTLA